MKVNFENEKEFEYFFQDASLKSDDESLLEVLNHFIIPHQNVIATNYRLLPERKFSFSFPKISEDFLSSLHLHLWTSAEHSQHHDFNSQSTFLCNHILKTLIILARSSQNIRLVSSDEFLQLLFNIFEVLNEKCIESRKADEYRSLFFYFLECLYDPCFFWRQSINRNEEENYGNIEEKRDTTKNNDRESNSNTSSSKAPEPSMHQPELLMPTSLHMQFIPLFYECLINERLKLEHRIQLMYLFLASVHGYPSNAVKVICPASLDAIMKVILKLSSSSSLNISSFQIVPNHFNTQKLFSLAMLFPSFWNKLTGEDEFFSILVGSISVLIWKVSSFPPDKRQVEVSSILDAVWDVIWKLSHHDDHNKATSFICLLIGLTFEF